MGKLANVCQEIEGLAVRRAEKEFLRRHGVEVAMKQPDEPPSKMVAAALIGQPWKPKAASLIGQPTIQRL